MAERRKRPSPERLAANPPGLRKKGLPKQGKMDFPFLILVLGLLCFGLIMLFSATYAYSYYNTVDNNSYFYISKQLIFAAIGVVLMWIVSFIPYHLYRKFVWVIFAGGLGLLCVTLAMPAVNGAKRWIFFGGIQFQPSELMKFAMVVVCAWLISRYMGKTYKTKKGNLIPAMRTFRQGVVPFVCALAPVILVMMLQPHTSGTILIVAICAIMMIVGGAGLRWFLLGGSVGGSVLLAYIYFTDKMAYAWERIEMWFDPFKDTQDAGFQTVQSLYAIGSGGFFGVGIGNSKQKHLFIPEPQNDFIFAIVCEELGFMGALLVISLFALLIWRGLLISIRAHDKFGALVCFGLIVQVGLQALLNIGVVTNTIPNTGISLPFFSYGGTSLVVLLCEMGIVLNISRTADLRRTS